MLTSLVFAGFGFALAGLSHPMESPFDTVRADVAGKFFGLAVLAFSAALAVWLVPLIQRSRRRSATLFDDDQDEF